MLKVLLRENVENVRALFTLLFNDVLLHSSALFSECACIAFLQIRNNLTETYMKMHVLPFSKQV